ncbi:hypothetical protein KF840_09245 [bacterium]|nr:hypothetical protein [bacterium]
MAAAARAHSQATFTHRRARDRRDLHPGCETAGPFGGRSIKRQGQLSARGFVELMLIEPLSEQEMWVRKVELAPASDAVDVD